MSPIRPKQGSNPHWISKTAHQTTLPRPISESIRKEVNFFCTFSWGPFNNQSSCSLESLFWQTLCLLVLQMKTLPSSLEDCLYVWPGTNSGTFTCHCPGMNSGTSGCSIVGPVEAVRGESSIGHLSGSFFPRTWSLSSDKSSLSLSCIACYTKKTWLV